MKFVFVAGLLSLTTVLAPCVLAQELIQAVRVTRTDGGARDERAAARERYDAGSVGEALFGDGYREIWGIPVRADVLDLTGFTLRSGSTDLFLEDSEGRRYIVQTMDRDAGDDLPRGFRKTFIEDVLQDQVSSLNPFAALVAAPLAGAAGVRHLGVELVIVPDSPALGSLREEFAGELAFLQAEAPAGGIGHDVLLERLKSGAAVGQRAFLRARLFDMWIGDRQRDAEAWFWILEDDLYVPVAANRAYAFARHDGFLNRVGRFIGKHPLRLQTYFGEEIDNLTGLNYAAAPLDYLFTSDLDRDEWAAVAEDLRAVLTDDAIERAVRAWPEQIFEEVGAETIFILRRRRDDLPRAAAEYYRKLMQNVDVIGSDEPEMIEIHRLDEGMLEVTVKTAGRTTYERRLDPKETDEVRIFGLGGADEFMVHGDTGISLFLVGGDGDDSVRNDGGRNIRFFDVEREPDSRGVKVKRLRDASRNGYTPHGFDLDRGSPAVAFDYDSDEGIYVGGGWKLRRSAFMRYPFASRHKLTANFAPRSRGFNVTYDGHINEIFFDWDAVFDANFLDEDLFNDFYGLGNETSGSDFNRGRFTAHFRWITVYPAFHYELGRSLELGVGPYFEYANIEPPEGISEERPNSGFTAREFVDTYFAGILSRIEFDGREGELTTRSGLHFLAEAGVHTGVRNTDMRFARVASELSYTHTLPLPGRYTIALRGGGATNFGDFAFYQANTLGGRENLRGFRKTRFAGRSAAFANAELRARVADFNVYVTRGELGAFGFFDIGRVWADDESSDVWHQGYGAGIWITPFYRFVVSGSLGFSDEGRVLDLSFGLFY